MDESYKISLNCFIMLTQQMQHYISYTPQRLSPPKSHISYQEIGELHHPQPQPPQQQQPEPTPQDPNAMSLDEPAEEEQHQQQDPEEEVEDEDDEDDLQKPETLKEDQPHTLEVANHDAEANDAEEEEENEDPNLGFQEVRRDRGLQGRH
ncbi:hypothetical protein Fmac_027382 [Flemingia macrophylla]|uniref:Uncharacterized protein n=1 Tax=Flemingia macrophylla TaxID=520843 RepID=A0ABD1LHS1_9FABA